MTVDELRKEADKMGYKISKKPNESSTRMHMKFLPCICGRKRVPLYYGSKGYFHWCQKCGTRVGELSASKEDARHKWNALIERISKEAI